MAFTTIGVQFVTQGLGAAAADVKEFADELSTLQKRIDDMGKGFLATNASISTTTDGLRKNLSAVKDANGEWQVSGKFTEQLRSGLDKVTQATDSNVQATDRQSRSWVLMVAAGVLVRDTIRGIIDGLKGVIGEAINSIETFQRLGVGMKSMLTRELVNTGMDFQQALGKAVPKAKAMMDELMRYSIIAPYALESTVNIMRQAQAYGFNADQAMTFAKALQNVSAATGVGNEVMGRMAYNLAQIRLVGKVTQRDIRDLGNAAFDLMGFLRSLGKEFKVEINTLEDFNNAIASGKLTWDQFVTGFATFSGKLGDATKELGRTLFGVKQRMTNILDILGINLLEPAVQSIVNRISDLQDSFLKAFDTGYIQAFGQVFGEVVEGLLYKIETLGISLGLLGKRTDWQLDYYTRSIGQNLSTTLNKSFGEMAYDALKWGIEVVSEFAVGMIRGASTVLVTAMDVIGGALSFWLSSSSPPRVAPDMEKWGLAAIASWLHGFKEADFSILESIQSPLQSILDILGKSDLYVGISASITQALSEIATMGKTSIDIIGQLMGIGTQYGVELAELARRQLELAAANKAVTDSEKKMIEADEKIADLTLEYNRLRRSGAPKSAIRAKALELEAARKARIEAEKENKAAIAKADVLKDQIKLQEQILQQLIAIARAMEKAATAVGAGKGPSGKEDELDYFPKPALPSDFSGALTKNIEAIKQKIRDALADLFKPIQEAWDKTKPDRDAITKSWDELTKKINQAWKTYGKPVADSIGSLIPKGLLENLGWAAGAIAVLGVAMGVAGIAGGILAGVIGLITSPIGLLIIALALLKTAWDNDFMGIATSLTNWWDKEGQYILIGLGVELGKVKDQVIALADTLKKWWDNEGQYILIGLGVELGRLKDRLVAFFTDPHEAFVQFRKDWDALWVGIEAEWTGFWNRTGTQSTKNWNDAADGWKKMWDNIGTYNRQGQENAQKDNDAFWDKTSKQSTKNWDDAVDGWKKMWDNIGTELKLKGAIFQTNWKKTWEDTGKQAKLEWDDISLKWNTMLSDINTELTRAGDQLGKDWQALLDGFGKAVDDMITNIKTALGIASPSSIFYDFGKALVDGLVNGFVWAVQHMADIGKNLIEAIWSGIWKRLQEFFSGGGGGSSQTYTCPIDGQTFSSQAALDAHTVSAHGTVTPPAPTVYTCPICGQTFPSAQALYTHQLYAHGGASLAIGGVVNKATNALIGESGPEAVIPLNRPYRAMQILASAMNQRYALGRQLAPATIMATAQAGPQRNYNLYMTTTTPPHNVAQDFAMLRAIGV